MRFAVSNIAWTHAERLEAYQILGHAGMEGLEIAPGVLFAEEADCFQPSPTAERCVRAEVEGAGLRLVSMQALLFGVQGAALFGTGAERACFEAAMGRAIALAGRLQIPNLVFGAPRQRVVPEGMGLAEAMDHALATFRRLGEAAMAAGTAIAIEANPAAYGTNFLNRQAEAQGFVDALNQRGISLMLDVGAMKMNREVVDIAAITPLLGHVHLSEPELAPAPADIGQTAALLGALAQAGYARAVSIEMKRDASGLAAVRAAVDRLAAARDLAGGMR